MRSEEAVPLEERYLIVEGHLSAKTRRSVRVGLRKDLAPSSRVCFVSSAYADLPLGKEFEIVFAVGPLRAPSASGSATSSRFHARHTASAQPAKVVIEEVMDTEYQPLPQLPDGAKTICVLDFPEGVPFMIDDLPTVRDWNESPDSVVLCSSETLAALKRGPRRHGIR